LMRIPLGVDMQGVFFGQCQTQEQVFLQWGKTSWEWNHSKRGPAHGHRAVDWTKKQANCRSLKKKQCCSRQTRRNEARAMRTYRVRLIPEGLEVACQRGRCPLGGGSKKKKGSSLRRSRQTSTPGGEAILRMRLHRDVQKEKESWARLAVSTAHAPMAIARNSRAKRHISISLDTTSEPAPKGGSYMSLNEIIQGLGGLVYRTKI